MKDVVCAVVSSQLSLLRFGLVHLRELIAGAERPVCDRLSRDRAVGYATRLRLLALEAIGKSQRCLVFRFSPVIRVRAGVPCLAKLGFEAIRCAILLLF